jgi:hypothetical protein
MDDEALTLDDFSLDESAACESESDDADLGKKRADCLDKCGVMCQTSSVEIVDGGCRFKCLLLDEQTDEADEPETDWCWPPLSRVGETCVN